MTTQNISINTNRRIPLVLTKKVIDKITEWCRNLPNNEWSGVLFYNIEGTINEDNFKIICVDFYVQDIGSSAYTEYSEKDNVYSLNYADENDLLDCYTGIIHSHNVMGAFFSNTDLDTLKEKSVDMPHFLSVIVNNKLDCVAKLTRIVKFDSANLYYTTYNDKVIKQDNHPFNNLVFTNIIDCDIIKEGIDTSLSKEVEERINELKKSVKNTPIPCTQDYSSLKTPYVDTDKVSTTNSKPQVVNVVNNENNNVVNDIKQPTLFDNEEEEENMEPLPFDVQDAVCKIITGDALFNYNNDIKVITPYLNNIESRYFKAFGNKENIKSFLTNYIDWIVWEYIEGAGDTADIAYAIINELEKLTSPYKKDRCFVLNLIIELLTDYI